MIEYTIQFKKNNSFYGLLILNLNLEYFFIFVMVINFLFFDNLNHYVKKIFIFIFLFNKKYYNYLFDNIATNTLLLYKSISSKTAIDKSFTN